MKASPTMIRHHHHQQKQEKLMDSNSPAPDQPLTPRRTSARLRRLAAVDSDTEASCSPQPFKKRNKGTPLPSLTSPSSSLSSSNIMGSSQLTASTNSNARDAWAYEYHDRVDPTITFLYTPHTLTLMSAFLACLVYLAFHTGQNALSNALLGLGVGTAVLVLIGVLNFKDGPFIRPHPAFWRAILGLGVAYQLILIFALFQSKDTLRVLLGQIDSSLGVPLPERSYAEQCSITPWSNVWEQLDIFVWAHAIGWFGKALIFRDAWICWVLSITFELLEYSLQHQLPNFAECWWDHWILDVLLTNWLGMWIGMKTCDYFAMRAYEWRGIKEIPGVPAKMKRVLQQLFLPHSWTSFEWAMTKCIKNYVAVIALIYLALQCEVNLFYLKYILWIQPSHPVITFRLILFFFFCMPAVREVYQYLRDPRCKHIGAHAWMTSVNILTELLICIKFGQDEFTEPFPSWVLVFWSCVLLSLVTFAIVNFGMKRG